MDINLVVILFWGEGQILKKLKFLDVSHSYHLRRTPDFSGNTNLEVLVFNNCTSLINVHESVTCLDKLVTLDLEDCKNLRALLPGIHNIDAHVNLSGISEDCKNLRALPPRFRNIDARVNLRALLPCIRNRRALPPCIRNIDARVNLSGISEDCKNLRALPPDIHNIYGFNHLRSFSNFLELISCDQLPLHMSGDINLILCKRFQVFFLSHLIKLAFSISD